MKRQPIVPLPEGTVVRLTFASSPAVQDFDKWLVSYIERMPIEDIDDQFQRGYLAALLCVYEARGLDPGDARYQAGLRLAARMRKT